MMSEKNNSLKYLLPVRCAVFPLIFIAAAALTGKKLSELSNIRSIAAAVVNILPVLLLFVLTKRNGSSFAELINYRKGTSKPKQTAADKITRHYIITEVFIWTKEKAQSFS